MNLFSRHELLRIYPTEGWSGPIALEDTDHGREQAALLHGQNMAQPWHALVLDADWPGRSEARALLLST